MRHLPEPFLPEESLETNTNFLDYFYRFRTRSGMAMLAQVLVPATAGNALRFEMSIYEILKLEMKASKKFHKFSSQRNNRGGKAVHKNYRFGEK